MVFRHQRNGDPVGFGFVGEQLPHPAVGPRADLLLIFPMQPFAIADIPHIADGQRPGLALHGKVDDRATDLVFNVPDASAALKLELKADGISDI
jgi:hypothetical protein